MAKKVESKESEEIKNALEAEKLIIGTERTLKELKKGNVSKVFVSANCPEDVREDLSYYSSLSKFETVELEILNDELGIVCKKPFSVSIVCIKK